MLRFKQLCNSSSSRKLFGDAKSAARLLNNQVVLQNMTYSQKFLQASVMSRLQIINQRQFSSQDQQQVQDQRENVQISTFDIQSADKQFIEIQSKIDNYEKNVREKTSRGREIALRIGKDVKEESHRKLQRYNMFVNKMNELYRSEANYRRKQRHLVKKMDFASLYTQAPLKDILRYYNSLSERGFEAESINLTLQCIYKAVQGKGNTPLIGVDYSTHEMFQSWRMVKLVEDIKFGLRPDQFFNPYQLGKVSRQLGDLGYKNTELIPLFFQKLHSQIEERKAGKQNEQNVTYEDTVYGDRKNFLSRHHVFTGFQDSQEFQEYLEILLEWEGNEKESYQQEAAYSVKGLDQEALDVQNSIKDVIHSALQVKELQQEYQASIESLRQQYFQMQEAHDKHKFLEENPYIKYDLLELQELLVKGGYLNPYEIDSAVHEEPFNQRMNRASQVFYDYVLNYSPEMISPQYDKFYEAASQSVPPKQKVEKQASDHNFLNLSSLSQTLTGLSQQAMSYKRDTIDKDYLHQYYRDLLMPQERENPYQDQTPTEYVTVFMERHYLKGWKIFQSESAKLIPQLISLIQEYKNDVQGQLYALQALASCKLDMAQTKEQIIENCLQNMNDQTIIELDASIEGLKGLAFMSQRRDNASTLAKKLIDQIYGQKLTFNQQLDTLWTLCILEQYDNNLCRYLVRDLNRLSFDRIDNDINYDGYQKILDIYYGLKWEVPEGESSPIESKLINYALQQTEKGQKLLKSRYIESQSHYDPFKQRVVQALSTGLTKSSIDHQVIFENQLYGIQHMDIENLKAESYPYKPDVVTGYKGNKVGLFVLSEDKVTSDTNRPNGLMMFRMRVLEKASQNELKAASVAVPQVVRYDVQDRHITMNTSFNFIKELDQQLKIDQDNKEMENYSQSFDALSDLGAEMMKDVNNYSETINSVKDFRKLDNFVRCLADLFKTKQQNEVKYDAEVKAAGYNEIRLQLMKLDLQYQRLNERTKSFIQKYVKPQNKSFNRILQQIKDSLPVIKLHRIDTQELLTSWQGARLDVEMPAFNTESMRKSIVPEMINQRFMWVKDYFHYQDWKEVQQQTFDNFNLLVIPENQTNYQYFFNQENKNRKIPQGIFPFPNHKRLIMQPSAKTFELSLQRHTGNDDITMYQKEPFKLMVINELKKSDTLEPISKEVSMITNLQNIKQGLKQDYSDREILETILINLNFTEKLIEEHLSESNNDQLHTKDNNDKKQTARDHKKANYVNRKSEDYRKFVESTYYVKDREDPFTHFYLKEAGKIERVIKTKDTEKELNIEEYSATSNDKVEEIAKQKETLQDKIDNMLLENELENEDLQSISHPHRQNVKVVYDLKSLIKSENIHDIEPELVDEGISDKQYLEIQRRRAETKLIKAKIIYKLHNQGSEENSNFDEKYKLTKLEEQYLKNWLADLNQNKDRNVLNLRDSLVPTKKETTLNINDLDAKDFYTLNSITKVQFDRKLHGDFSLSDLVLELGHFLDEDVVNKVEMDVFGKRISREWGLQDDFKLIETRNKEVGLVINELEEVAWRSAGRFDEYDLEVVQRMISIQRNKNDFDKQYYENDMKSLKDFVNEVNNYDNRIKLLEYWLVRKEDEWKARIALPPAEFKKTDKEIFERLDKPLKVAREKLVSKFLVADQFGNAIENKEYKDLTSVELHSLSEQLAVRLYLFNYDYPTFLPQVVKAIIEHPSLLRSDKDLLTTYCKIFELDWQGDKLALVNNDFMGMVPMYLQGQNLKSYGVITNERIRDMIQQASNPFVNEITQRMLNY